MNIVRRIKSKIFPAKKKALIYDDALSAAYQSVPITSTNADGLRLLLVHDGGPLCQTLIDRFSIEKMEVTEINVQDGKHETMHEADALLIVFEWTPVPEMMRLKSISNETYNSFIAKYTDIPLQIVSKVLSANENIKLLTLLPSFAFTERYGFSLYGIAANHLVALLEHQCGIEPRKQYINIQYAKTLKALTNAKANIINKEGSLGHILLREQVAAVVTMLLERQGEAIKSSILKIGVGDSVNMEYPVVNKRIDGFKEGSVCAGALADKNIMMLYNDNTHTLAFREILISELSYVEGDFAEDNITEQQLLQLKRKLVGPIDILVNVIKPASNCSPITQLYRWLQTEVPFLAIQNQQVCICNVFLVENDFLPEYEVEIKKFISSLARLLGNHSFVVNSIISNNLLKINESSKLVSFLCSKYGEALTGETIIL